MRKTATTVVVLAALLAAAIASPAVGGPSIGSVAKTAKKALKTGKSASRAARSAKRTANSARSAANSAKALAGSANGKADQALARPVVTVGGITPVESVVSIPASGFETTAAVCPAGQRPISGGVTAVSGAGGVWADRANPERTAWIGGGEDLAGTGGTLTVVAYCAPGGQATAAAVDRAAIRRELVKLESAKDAR